MGNKLPHLQGQGVVNHQTLGPVRVKNAQGKQQPQKTMELNCSVQNQLIYQDWCNKVKQICTQEQLKDIILLPLSNQYEKHGLCGSSGIVKITYEYFPIVLKNQIQNRKSLNKDFEQIELWYLLYFIIQAGNKFQMLKQKIGDLSPENIFINEGQVRILSTCSMPTQMDNFTKYLQNRQTKVYLAPEQYNTNVLALDYYPKHLDPCKAQVFTIATVILSMGILQQISDIYENQKINKDKLLIHQDKFRSKYSLRLYEFIQNMLRINPQTRSSCSEILNRLKIYEKYILDVEPVENWQF